MKKWKDISGVRHGVNIGVTGPSLIGINMLRLGIPFMALYGGFFDHEWPFSHRSVFLGNILINSFPVAGTSGARTVDGPANIDARVAEICDVPCWNCVLFR